MSPDAPTPERQKQVTKAFQYGIVAAQQLMNITPHETHSDVRAQMITVAGSYRLFAYGQPLPSHLETEDEIIADGELIAAFVDGFLKEYQRAHTAPGDTPGRPAAPPELPPTPQPSPKDDVPMYR